MKLRAASLALCFLLLPGSSWAASLVIQVNDPAGQGFNDTTPRTALPTNAGTTLGQQRLNVFNFAAARWAERLAGSGTIIVRADWQGFTSANCSSSSGTLGFAGAFYYSGFSGAPLANTWYPAGLANQLNGSDVDAGNAEMQASFNPNVDGDPNCLGGAGFYYGTDHNAGSKIDLLNVVMHEIGHGLGVATLTSRSTGTPLQGRFTIYDHFLYDQASGLFWTQMTDAQRQGSAISNGSLTWNSLALDQAAQGYLTAGLNSGHVRMFDPNPLQAGSSVAHFSTAATPDLLMEPFLSRSLRGGEQVDLTTCLLKDMGWTLARGGSCRDVNVVAPPVTPISNGVAVAGISGNQGSERFFSLNVPAGASNLSFTTSGGSGDADLFVRRGDLPSDSASDCASTNVSSDETCSFSAPAAGTWFVRLLGYSTYSNVSLVGRFDTGPDTTPDAFGFTAQPGVATGSVRTSNAITVSGISEPAAIGVSNGSYSIGCTGTFVTAAGTIGNGQSVCVRHTSAGSPNATTSTPLTIGGVTGTFSSTTGAEDTTPNSFSFTFQTGVETGSMRTSNAITLAGINVPTPISVSAGSSYSIGCTGSFVTTAGTISNGQTVCVRHTAAATANAITSTVLTVGSYSGLFRSTTGANDSTPNAFSFTAQTGVPVNSVRTSNTVTVAGINVAVPIAVSGVAGSGYSIGCTGSFVSTAGTISNGQTVCVRHTAAPTGGATVSSTLDIGGVTASFSSTASGSDTTPDPFSFTAQTGVATGTVRTSNAITVSGISEPAVISVSSGSYSIGCTSTFVTAAGTIGNGQTVCVRHTSAGSPNATTNTPLTIGGVTGTFSSTTGADDTTPNSFSFTFQTGVETGSVRTSNAVTIAGINAPAPISVSAGSSYSIGCTGTFATAAGTISNGQSVCVRHTASPAANTITTTVLTVGSYSGLFRSTTGANDTTPSAFSFAAQTGVPVSSVRTSNTITVAGINAAAPIAISGVAGSGYSIGCTGSFVTTAGTIGNGQTVCVQHTASPTGGTTVSSTLDIGGISGVFSTTTTSGPDTTPDAFGFTAQPGVATGSVRTSNAITVSGISEPAAIGVSNGSYSIGCTGTFVTAAGTIGNGQSVCVRHTSAGSPNATTSTPLTIGGVTGTFSSTTGAEDTTPNSFSFTFQTGVETGSMRTSNAITLAGINVPTPISVSAGSSYSIGCTGSFVTTAGTISNGQTVCVRHTAAATANAITSTVLTVGSYSGLFRSTTGANDSTPNAFSFTAQTGVPVNSVRTSNTVTVAGINVAVPIAVSGVAGSGYSIGCTGSFVSTAGTISNGQTVCVRHTAAPTGGATVSSTLDIGGVTAAFSSTTSP